mgnify:CR=1 FL=1
METEESEAMIAEQKARHVHTLNEGNPIKEGRVYHRKENRKINSRFSPTESVKTDRKLAKSGAVFN